MAQPKRYSLVYVKQPTASLLCDALTGPFVCVKSRAEFVSATKKRKPVVAFVDADLLASIQGVTTGVTIVAVVSESRSEAVRPLTSFGWVSHLVSRTMLASPLAGPHIAMLLERLEHGPEQHALASAGVGRVALLASSARREARFERMREFMELQGMSAKTVTATSDIAEELVTNALYDAPMEAGYFQVPVPRTDPVDLPPEHACEISYGIEDGSAFVRVRDPFGALTRERLLGVVNRCNDSSGVALDESRGGAGLGLWRVFSSASSIVITVIPSCLTDVLVRIETSHGRAIAKQLLAVDLFLPQERALREAQGRFAAEHDHDLMDDSFTAMWVA